MAKKIIITLIIFASYFSSFAQNLLTNGSLNGTCGMGSSPTGWTLTGTPDVSSPSCGYLLGGAGSCCTTWFAPGPTASPDGGTWINTANTESISQTVNVIPNAYYRLSYYYTNMGYNCPAWCVTPPSSNCTVPPLLTVTNQTGFTNSTTNPALYNWTTFNHTFKATNNTLTVQLRGQNTGGCALGYGAYDGISLVLHCDKEIANAVAIGSNTSITNSTQFIASQGNSPTSKKYYLDGDFTVNNSISFNNCEILMASGARIDVQNGITLTLNTSTLHSCSNLWMGIFVNNGGILNATNSTIKDAHVAITYINGATTSLTGNTFSNNVIGIVCDGAEVFSNNKTGNIIKGNTFTASNGVNLRPKYLGFSSLTKYNVQNNQPNIITKPFAGILVLDVDRFDINNATTDPSNIFSNMTNGIVTHNVKYATINHCKFDNITPITGNTNLANGIGIYYFSGLTDQQLMWSMDGEFKSTGLGKGVTSFSNTTKGIYAEQCYNTIDHQKMTGMAIGIDVKNSRQCNVANNHITATNYDVKLNNLTICPLYNITNNQLFLNATNEAFNAVQIDNQMTEWCRHNFNYISNNCINTTGTSGFGISTNNIKNTAANTNGCNTISLSTPTTSLGGIVSNNCYSVQTDNYIFSSNRTTQSSKGGLAGAFPVAIHTNATYGEAFHNQYNNILVGMRYTGNCLPVNGRTHLIYKNRFQNLTTGFRFDATLTLNDLETTIPWASPTIKYNFGNEFNGTITNRAFGAGSTFPLIPYNTSSGVYNPSPSSPAFVFGLLNSQTNYPPSFLGAPNNTATCGTLGLNSCEFPIVFRYTPILVEPVLTWSKLRISILNKTLNYVSYAPAMIWQNELKLYNELKPMEANFADTSLEKQFIQEKEAENMDEIAALVQAEASMLNPNDNTLEVLSQTVFNIQHEIDSLTIVHDTIIDSLKSGVMSQIEAEQSALLSAQSSLQSAMNQVEIQRDRIADSLRVLNDSIQATMPTDSFQLAYNNIFFDKYAQGDYNLSTEQIATMQYLANQCPFINENVVFKARSAYRAYNDSIYYNDSVLCTQKGLIYKSAGRSTAKVHDWAFSLSPNPAIDRAILKWNANINQSLTIYVTDIQGRVFANQSVEAKSNSFEITTQNWSEGIYRVQVYQDKDLLHSAQLQITKP